MKYTATSENHQPKYQWHAKYENNTTITQQQTNYQQLNKTGLRQFSIIDPKKDTYIITIHLQPGDTIAYRTRTIIQEGHHIIDKIHIITTNQLKPNTAIFISEIYETTEIKQYDQGHYNKPNYRDHDNTPVL